MFRVSPELGISLNRELYGNPGGVSGNRHPASFQTPAPEIALWFKRGIESLAHAMEIIGPIL